jgi:cathepsin L
MEFLSCSVLLFATRVTICGAVGSEDFTPLESSSVDSGSNICNASLLQFAAHRNSQIRIELPSFASFISEYGRNYKIGTSDYDMRRDIYEREVQQVQKHNSNPHRLWTAGVNRLSDHTEIELSSLRGLVAMSLGKTKTAVFLHKMREEDLPLEKSWSHLKSLTVDTDQMYCGSCWAVATATVLAANSEINGHDNTFSVQELVDCVPNPRHCGGTGGCQGSTVELAMEWVMERGLATTIETPYLAEDGVCKKDQTDSKNLVSSTGHNDDLFKQRIAVGFHAAHHAARRLGLKGWERLPENQHHPLLEALALRGPVAVSIAASGMNSYSSGIYDACVKDAVVDHAAVLIGYAKDRDTGDTPYWLLKNSWGLDWGEKGNIRILRNSGTYCGIDNQPEVGTGCDGGPSSVEVCGMCGILYDAVVPHFVSAT